MRKQGELQRVLVIDDDDDLADALREVIRDFGYSVAVARHGADALELVKHLAPNVILLDLNMPFMDGWSFVSQYRRGGKTGARIVLVTAHADAPDIATRLGADGFIAKPFAVDDLIMVLAEQLPVS
jgi:two-component system chemotaxis response regulator CheY